jgi:hypothetical protein
MRDAREEVSVEDAAEHFHLNQLSWGKNMTSKLGKSAAEEME